MIEFSYETMDRKKHRSQGKKLEIKISPQDDESGMSTIGQYVFIDDKLIVYVGNILQGTVTVV